MKEAIHMFEVHRIRLRDSAEMMQNAVRIDGTWSVACDCGHPAVEHALDDYRKYFEESFGFLLAQSGDKTFSVLLDEAMGNSFGIDVSDEDITFIGGTYETIVQAIFFSEDVMNGTGIAALEKKSYRVSPEIFPRITASGLGINEFSPEYMNILLHNGYNGIIFYDTVPFENSAQIAKEYGLLTYLVTENIETYENIDAVIYEKEPDELSIRAAHAHKCIFSAEYWQNDFIGLLPQNATVLLSFDEGQTISREGVDTVTKHGSLLSDKASDKFVKMKTEAESKGITVWASTASAGRTSELPTIPFVPAMNIWSKRTASLLEQKVAGTVESGYYGFVPSIVGEFIKAKLLSPCNDDCLNRLCIEHYGQANVDKMMTVFKKISDGVSCLFADAADISGPLAYGPAYPLVCDAIYAFPFDKKDVTYEIDMMLRAADGFNKAAMILKNIENDEAKALRVMCAFAVNTFVTCANVKRWYRRIAVLQAESTDYKRKFLIEQMMKIGNEEIRNATDTAELIFEMPELGEAFGEQLSTINDLEAKISLTQSAMQTLHKECDE